MSRLSAIQIWRLTVLLTVSNLCKATMDRTLHLSLGEENIVVHLLQGDVLGCGDDKVVLKGIKSENGQDEEVAVAFQFTERNGAMTSVTEIGNEAEIHQEIYDKVRRDFGDKGKHPIVIAAYGLASNSSQKSLTINNLGENCKDVQSAVINTSQAIVTEIFKGNYESQTLPGDATYEERKKFLSDFIATAIDMTDTLEVLHKAGFSHGDPQLFNWTLPDSKLRVPLLFDFSQAQKLPKPGLPERRSTVWINFLIFLGSCMDWVSSMFDTKEPHPAYFSIEKVLDSISDRDDPDIIHRKVRQGLNDILVELSKA